MFLFWIAMVWFNALISVAIVSSISLIGVIALGFGEKKLHKALLFLVSFSAGSLFGDAFIHLLPEAAASMGFGLEFSLLLIGGILFFFILEKFIHWRHCHMETSEDHPHPVGIMNLVGDALHNFIDGLVIAAAYLASPAIGIATTLAVVFHEIPQEIGDFGVLLHAGYTKAKAIFFNFLSALTAILGAVVVLVMNNSHFATALLPFTAGGFIYIAGSDLIPELKKENESLVTAFSHLLWIVLGIGVMVALTFLEA